MDKSKVPTIDELVVYTGKPPEQITEQDKDAFAAYQETKPRCKIQNTKGKQCTQKQGHEGEHCYEFHGERLPIEAIQVRPKPSRKEMVSYPVAYKVDTSQEGLSYIVGAQEDVPLSTVALWAEEYLSYNRSFSIRSISLLPLKAVGLPKGA